jgi:hypothetical protein
MRKSPTDSNIRFFSKKIFGSFTDPEISSTLLKRVRY